MKLNYILITKAELWTIKIVHWVTVLQYRHKVLRSTQAPTDLKNRILCRDIPSDFHMSVEYV